MKKSAYLIVSISLLIFISSFQQKKEIIQGDLYFGFFRFGSFYNQPDSVVNAFKIYADTVDRTNIRDLDKLVLEMYDTLKKENLLFNPFIELYMGNDSIIKLYLAKSDYDKIKIYKRKELQDHNKKVRIEAEARYLGNGMFVCEKLISVKKVHGDTFQTQSKFKIEDYY
ncbi:hypothetical protein [Cytophaga aurantiaca]|uniref:hypothetical protein n=1 Tax=Cytophaga aurantiaca TaxID=29530 RepID=UPI0003642E4A|nr:hypothetical protein [Cytophaga aurantiaca]